MLASDKSPPTVDLSFTGIVSYIRPMEKLTYTLGLQKDKGEKYWRKWGCYSEKMNTDKVFSVFLSLSYIRHQC